MVISGSLMIPWCFMASPMNFQSSWDLWRRKPGVQMNPWTKLTRWCGEPFFWMVFLLDIVARQNSLSLTQGNTNIANTSTIVQAWSPLTHIFASSRTTWAMYQTGDSWWSHAMQAAWGWDPITPKWVLFRHGQSTHTQVATSSLVRHGCEKSPAQHSPKFSTSSPISPGSGWVS